MDFHKRVRDGYRELMEKDPARIKRIDASKTIEEMRDDIYACLEELCRSRGL
jgi:dTMP kinase